MDQLAKVYGGPLVRGLKESPEKALHRIKFSILRRLRDKLMQSAFSERAKRALSKSLVVKIGPSSLTISSTHPAFIKLMKPQKRNQMTWLTKARAPIPIITETGELIFRSATVKSMKDGRWIHPGRQGYDFVDKAKKEAVTQIKSAILNEIRQAVVRAAQKSNKAQKR